MEDDTTAAAAHFRAEVRNLIRVDPVHFLEHLQSPNPLTSGHAYAILLMADWDYRDVVAEIDLLMGYGEE